MILQRKLEREFAIYGGAAPDSGIGSDGSDEDNEGDEEAEPVASVAGNVQLCSLLTNPKICTRSSECNLNLHVLDY